MDMKQQIVNADCRKYLKGLWCPSFDLIIADPPFNIGQQYANYIDDIENLEYEEFLRQWIWLCWGKLNEGSAMICHGSNKVARQMTIAIEALGLSQNIEQELSWAYQFGQCTYKRFIETNCRAIVVRKPGERKWNVENVLTPSKRMRMGDPRIETAKFQGLIPYGTVWGVQESDLIPLEPLEAEPFWGRVQGNNKERWPHSPNQLPLVYVERLIGAYSNPGDLVYDPFGGSGTTVVAAKRLKRNCITTEIDSETCKQMELRLETAWAIRLPTQTPSE